MNDALEDVIQPTPFTQILIAEALDNIEKSALLACEERRTNECATPNQCDSNVKIGELKAIPLPVVAPRRTQRFVQLTDKLRSPNFSRIIDPNTALKALEERVSGCIFAGLDSEWELLFESAFGDIGHRGIFESMIPGSNIHVTVIDIWASFLNHQERHRNKSSPLRLFISCTLLCNFVLEETIPIDRRFNMFSRRMDEHLEKYKQLINFHDVELVFFPVLIRDHYYLIVFDLIKYECIIIDNIYSEESLLQVYGNIPFELDVLFKLYIRSSKHPKRSQMQCVRPVKFVMEWMTKKNYTDCGIFLMRHMETYKGEGVDKWNVNLEAESAHMDAQQKQLDELRKKYVAKILTSNMNILKPVVHKSLVTYDILPDDEKKNFSGMEHLSRIESRIRLFY